tara:strand:+ start:174 stop:344 length:171 start_codon:yes stop_codon:yes gene_type:complete
MGKRLCPKITWAFIRRMNSKSGTILPIMSPEAEKYLLFNKGIIKAGCEPVNGIAFF